MQQFKILAVLCSITLFCVGPRPAWSHTFPERAEPRVGVSVAVPPTRVRIWFDSDLEPARSRIRVEMANGKRIDRGDQRVISAENMTLLEVSLPSLSPGTYHVIWSIVDRDGHLGEGDYFFTVQRER